MYTTLAFLALLGAPYIYEISSLRVNGNKRKLELIWIGSFPCQRPVLHFVITGSRILFSIGLGMQEQILCACATMGDVLCSMYWH